MLLNKYKINRISIKTFAAKSDKGQILILSSESVSYKYAKS